MKTYVLSFVVAASICFCLVFSATAQSSDLETEFSALSTKLASQIKDAGKKKVAALDFTDLQGASSEFGRYVAEQITVNLVSTKRDFSVLDRANLQRILAEHKLTALGLVDPENAKKLGQFAGVDALILGTIVPIGQNLEITAKIIATDSAEIVGAAKVKVAKSKDIEQMSEHQTTTPALTQGTPGLAIDKDSQQIGDLLLKVESLRLSGDQYTGYLQGTFVFKNTSAKSTLGIGLFSRSNTQPETKVTNDRGDEFTTGYTDFTGIKMAQEQGAADYLTDLAPGATLRSTIKFSIRWNSKAGNYPPYRLQSEIWVGVGDRGKYSDLKRNNFLVDVANAK